MKKSDLKTGMIVENAKGQRGKVMLGTRYGDIIAGTQGESDRQVWHPFDSLTETLEYKNGLKYDIVKVFEMGSNRFGGSVTVAGPLLWKREVIRTLPKYTLEQLQEKLGHKFTLIQ